jgi:beta-lactamase regulating signal transducer with metallopeptidase domain
VPQAASHPEPRVSHSAAFVAALKTPSNWPWIAGSLWLSGSLLMALLYAYRAWRFRRFVRLSAHRDHEIPARVGELAADLSVGVPPRVIVVDCLVSPMLWGVGQNTQMIFPAQLVKRLSSAELDSLLLHELAHYWRGDHYVRVLELACHVLYWWNPLVWFTRRQIETVEEQCCDAWVLQRQRGSRHSYAEALLTTIDFLCERPALAPPAACGLGEVDMLKLRLVQIMREEPASQLSPRTKALVLGLGSLLAPLEPALWAKSTPPAARILPKAIADVAEATPVPPTTPLPVRSTASAPQNRSSTPSADVQRRSRAPLPPLRPHSPHWATATARNGHFRLEARVGYKTMLIDTASSFRLDLTSHQITCVSFALDSKQFASGHDDALVRLWDSQTGGLVRSLRGAESPILTVHVSPDGSRVAAGTAAGHVIIWDLASGDELARLPSYDQPATCVRWSQRGDRLAVALGRWSQSEDAALLIWSPDEKVLLLDSPLVQPAGALDWLADDQALLVAAWNGQAQVWSVSHGELVSELQLPKDQVSAAAWSPDCPLANGWVAGQLFTRTP